MDKLMMGKIIMFGQSVYAVIGTRTILYMHLPFMYSIFHLVEVYITSFTYFLIVLLVNIRCIIHVSVGS